MDISQKGRATKMREAIIIGMIAIACIVIAWAISSGVDKIPGDKK